MKNNCLKWKGYLLEAALGETAPVELQNHLSQCPDCTAELAGLRARRERLEATLPLLANAEEPSQNLEARIVAAVEASATHRRPSLWPRWALAGAVAVLVIVVMVGWARSRRTGVTEAELRGAQALAQWRAPTDVLLRFPGQEFLNVTPKLGESYIKIPTAIEKEKSK